MKKIHIFSLLFTTINAFANTGDGQTGNRPSVKGPVLISSAGTGGTGNMVEAKEALNKAEGSGGTGNRGGGVGDSL